MSESPLPDDQTLGLVDPAFPVIPDVTIVAEIGRGGMGTVYRGHQPFVRRDVAVKVLKSDLGNTDSSRRFHREARLLASMSHPAIVACLAAGTTDAGLSYIVMELIDGPDLYHWLKENGKLETREALELTLSLARALSYADEQGIIHRDIKTANVLLALRKDAPDTALFPFDVKLADLGLARPQDLEGHTSMAVTKAGVALGTPSCMAPEQFDDPEKIDFRADIYGLGCVLFHCLTGQPAFPQQGLSEVFTTKLNPIAPNPRAVLPELSHPVSHLVSKMIATDREERHGDYAALIAEIEALLPELETGDSKPLWPRLLLAVVVIAVASAGTIFFLGNAGTSDVGGSTLSTVEPISDRPTSLPGSSPLAHVGVEAVRWVLEDSGQTPSTSLGYPAGSLVTLNVQAPGTATAAPVQVTWTLYQAPGQVRAVLGRQIAGFGEGPMGQLLLPRLAGVQSYRIMINVQPRQGDGPQGFESFSLAVDSTRDVRSIQDRVPLMNATGLIGWTERPGSTGRFKEADDYPGLQARPTGRGAGATAASIPLPAGDWQLSGAFRSSFVGRDNWFAEVGLWIGCSPDLTRMLAIKALAPEGVEAVLYELSTVEFEPGTTPLYGGDPHTGTPSKGLFHVPWGNASGDDISREVEFTILREGTRLSMMVKGQESAPFLAQLEGEPSDLGLFVVGGLGEFRDFVLSPVDEP